MSNCQKCERVCDHAIVKKLNILFQYWPEYLSLLTAFGMSFILFVFKTRVVQKQVYFVLWNSIYFYRAF